MMLGMDWRRVVWLPVLVCMVLGACTPTEPTETDGGAKPETAEQADVEIVQPSIKGMPPAPPEDVKIVGTPPAEADQALAGKYVGKYALRPDAPESEQEQVDMLNQSAPEMGGLSLELKPDGTYVLVILGIRMDGAYSIAADTLTLTPAAVQAKDLETFRREGAVLEDGTQIKDSPVLSEPLSLKIATDRATLTLDDPSSPAMYVFSRA